MRLKRLVARGFKSFADRTEFEFDSRLTGIIGPNGCGKSNVVDAIKWVLGDQRARSLRGAEMTDVIFKGAEGREAMGMAEVTITFEDPAGRIDGRTEIDIARRLTLDKESSYLLNGQEVRLRDVRDLLLDTGLGTGGYSVMEQGRIDAVLSANPETRRLIFEEAAGVARFKLQKKETLRKLERTDQNLARATDLLEERARRIKSLRIQAGKARRWHQLHAALRELRAALAVIEGEQLRAAWREQQAALAALAADLEAADGERADLDQRLATAEGELAAGAAALDGVLDELRAAQGELTAQRERAASQARRAADRRAELERGRQRAAGLLAQRDERAAVLAAARAELAQLEAELIELHKQLEEQRRAARTAVDALRALQREREACRERQLDLLHRRTRARNHAAEAAARVAAARGRDGRLGERREALAAERLRLAAERQHWQGVLADLATRERLLAEREAVALADLEQADAAAAAVAEREADLRYRATEAEGRREALLAMEAHMEGFDQGPRHVLEQRPPGLRGRLLDLIEIDSIHGTALEAALGPYVQALVVDTREHAAAIVRELAGRRLGRVLLLVEEAFADVPPATASSLLPAPPGVSRLADLVRHVESEVAAAGGAAPDTSRRLLDWLLRGVVVADFDIADSARADLCFVTPDGTLVCGPRLEGGAAAEGHQGLVVRRARIAELGEVIAALDAERRALSLGKELATGRVERLRRELKAIADAGVGVRRARHDGEAQEARLEARCADLDREAQDLDHEAGELRSAVCGGLARLGAALFDQFLLARREAVAAAAEAELGAAIAAADQEAQAQQRAEQELRLRQVQGGEAHGGLVRSIRMHEEAVRDFDRAHRELVERELEAERERGHAEAERVRLEQLAAATEQRLEQLAGRRAAAESGLAAVRQQRADLQSLAHQVEQRRAAAGEASNRARLAAAELEHRFARLEDRLREDTGVELRRCLGEVEGVGLVDTSDWPWVPVPAGAVEQLHGPPLPPAVVAAWLQLGRPWAAPGFDAEAARRAAQVLQSQKDRLGAVNLEAVRELDAEEGQFSDLEREVHDLKEARRALLETLRKLEAESVTLFEQTFAAARRNFQELFRKLFQGGKADMFLSNTDQDLLEAGIEIVAQPPGKQLQSINLLSGGERSLTAVAILFALFKVRPSPFCILDEVDAALDETNVERFLRVLREFTSQTQFCIVTHHKRTMAECQVLYGITMQRRGVSSRIAVALHEVDHVQDGAAVAPGRPDPAERQRVSGEEHVGF